MTWIVGDADPSHELVWRRACHRAATVDLAFNKFREDPLIQMICDNNSMSRAEEQVADSLRLWPASMWLTATICAGDDQGGEASRGYVRLGNHWLSTTGCRYLKILADCIHTYGPLNGLKITEIGGGYGGLARMIHNVFPEVEYTLVDFPEAMELQQRFVGKSLFHYDCEGDFLCDMPAADLLISSYAFSEVSHAGRDKFVQMIRDAAHGYFVWSIIGNPGLALTFDEAEAWFRQYHDIKRNLENPKDIDPAGLAESCTLRW